MPTISTSTIANATAYVSGSLVAISASGDALVIWCDGTNVKYSYASSPYSSWTTTTLAASIGGSPRWEAGLYKFSNDNVLVVTSNSSANVVSYLFTYNSGSHSWSPGSAVTILATSAAFGGGSVPMDADAQGRVWVAWINNSNVIEVYNTANNGTSWNASTTATGVSGGNVSVSLAYIGNYIVLAYSTTGGTWSYQRVDAHSATIGSWSAAASITNTVMDNGATGVCLRGVAGTNLGIFAGDEFSALPTQVYNAGTDTWSTITNIGASSSDREPTLVQSGANLYCLWCDFSATNNYSLVYKKWASGSQTWDSSSTTVVASGTNIAYPSAGFGNNSIGITYTVGTASPWNVNFQTVSFLTTNTMSSTDALSASDISVLQSWTVDALISTDIGVLQSWPVDALTASDLGVMQSWTIDALSTTDIGNAESWPVDALTTTDVGGVQSWLVESLTGTDSLLSTETSLLNEASSASDVGVSQSWNIDSLSSTDSLASTLTVLLTDPLSVTDSAQYTATALITDIASITDSFTTTQSQLVTESLLATESILATMYPSSTDGLATNESILVTDIAGISDASTVADSGGTQSWGIEALTATDATLFTAIVLSTEAITGSDTFAGVDLAIFADALSLTDSQLATMTLLSSEALIASDMTSATGNASVTDALTASDALLASESMAVVEPLNTSESTLETIAYSSAENLVASDTGGLQPGSVDALSASDSLSGTGTYLPTEFQTGVDVLLGTETALFTDVIPASDTSSMTQVPPGGVTNNQMTSTDLLTAADSFFATLAAIPLDTLIAADMLLSGNGLGITDTLSSSDGMLGASGPVFSDSLLGADSTAYQAIYNATEPFVGSSVLSSQGNYGISEIQAIAESLLASTKSVPIDALTILDAVLSASGSLFSESASAADTSTLQGMYSTTEPLIVSDTAFSSGGYIPSEIASIVESLLAVEQAAWIDIVPILDQFSTTHPTISPPVVFQAIFRDGVLVATFRDGATIVAERDGVILANYR